MKITSVKGFHDVLPGESARWSWVEQRSREVFRRYGYSEIRVPIAERTELFQRSLGETTDIVEKEMYTFDDRDGASLTLRPEGTASVVRAYVEHSLAQHEPVSRLFYMGPMFRRERPQKGRLRQFAQIGVEALGRDDASIDAEILLLLHDLLSEFRIRNPRLELNSLGDAQCRPGYRALLREFGAARRAQLCENCNSRLERNPLRILDCKNPSCQEATAGAPLMIDHLCAGCADHFATVRRIIDREQIPYTLAPRMVRGLDYYVRTAFEVTAEGLGSQNAVGGGGRYDGLVRALGGGDIPGIGFALGVERLLLSMRDDAGKTAESPEIFIAPIGAPAELEVMHLAHRWRLQGMRVETSAARSLKSQMRLADKSGAAHVLIVGEEELSTGAATVRDMRARRDFQRALAFELNADELRKTLAELSDQPIERTA